MDDEQLKKQQKQDELDKASQKTAHVAGKAAATAAGGAVGLGSAGGKLYDLASKTQVGQDIEKVAGKALQRDPIMNKAMEGLNKSGALDAVDKGIDMAGGDPSSVGDAGTKTLDTLNNLSSKKDSDDNSQSASGLTQGKGLFDSEKKKLKIFALTLGSIATVFFLIIILIVLFGSVLAPLQAAKNYIQGLWNNLVDWIIPSQQDLEKEYYDELKKVQQELNSDGVCIDINLITATLTAGRNFGEVLGAGNGNDPSGETEIVQDENGNPQEIPYKVMKKQVRLLANMQIMTKNYGLNSNLKDTTDYYCIDKSKEEYSQYENFQLVDGNTVDYFYDTDFFNRDNGLDSSSYELIARHDVVGFAKFFTKKSSEERNYAYYLYHPPFDENGDCSDRYAEDLLDELPENELEVSIGDYSTRVDSVYYWNLINSFIPEYYEDYLPNEEPAKSEKIKQIADEIYLLYEAIGPSQTCTVAYSGPSSLCPNGVTITNGDDVGTFSLEEYVAGVVGAELSGNHPLEAKKAQAVAARTYVLKYTDYCTKPIVDNSDAQNFTRNYSDFDRQAANETAGEILVDSNGKIFLSEYDSWYCKGSTTCVYTKLPNNESHTVTLSPEYLSRAIGGHGRGMSQWAAVDMAASGKNYREILSYFYSQGVEISLVISPTTTDGGEIITHQITNYLDVDQFNQTIFNQVIKSGLSTREGVVAAGTTLISNFYSQTGYKLPYELNPSGKYSGYGVDSSWGTNTGDATYPVNGLDCSGFISWAIHNGGFSYEIKSAQGWGNAGIKRSWSKGTVDNTAKAGDLIFNAPASANGTTGHIRMIIGVTDDGYVVAEASSRKNGMRITNVSFKSTGSYYLVDMSSYYANATKVTDYPM